MTENTSLQSRWGTVSIGDKVKFRPFSAEYAGKVVDVDLGEGSMPNQTLIVEEVEDVGLSKWPRGRGWEGNQSVMPCAITEINGHRTAGAPPVETKNTTVSSDS